MLVSDRPFTKVFSQQNFNNKTKECSQILFDTMTAATKYNSANLRSKSNDNIKIFFRKYLGKQYKTKPPDNHIILCDDKELTEIAIRWSKLWFDGLYSIQAQYYTIKLKKYNNDLDVAVHVHCIALYISEANPLSIPCPLLYNRENNVLFINI